MRKTYIYLAILIFLGFGLAFGLSIFLEGKKDENTNSIKTTDTALSTIDYSNSTFDNTDPVEEGIVSGLYADYTPEKLQDNSINLLFFYATWCPSCRELDENLNASTKEIPANLQILKVDYDKEPELKQKYDITLQHTIVQVDSNGELLNTIDGYDSIYTLEELLNSI